MGVDIRRLFKDPEITCFISEAIESVRDYYWYEENCLSHGTELAREYGRERDYGFMVHYPETWGNIGDIRVPHAAIMDDIEEDLRWEMINKHRPPIISFYSVPLLLTQEGAWYQKQAADHFWLRLAEYKQSFK
jgi:hypothetical protein